MWLVKTILGKLDRIEVRLIEIERGNKKTMAAIEDLNAELASFTTSVSNEIAASTAAITAALANNDSAAIETAVSSLKALQTTVDTYTASITPAPPVVPAT